jgi:hypothetical protein
VGPECRAAYQREEWPGETSLSQRPGSPRAIKPPRTVFCVRDLVPPEQRWHCGPRPERRLTRFHTVEIMNVAMVLQSPPLA